MFFALRAAALFSRKNVALTAAYALFGGGHTTITSAATSKFDFGTYVVSGGTSLATGHEAHGAAGNIDVGIFFSGKDSVGATRSQITDIYTHSTNAVQSGATLDAGAYGAVGTGNATLGLFAGNYVAGALTRKYAYATNIVTAGSNLGTSRNFSAGFGNSTMGYIGGGQSSSYVDKYQYSNDAVAPGTALLVAEGMRAAVSTPTVAYIGPAINVGNSMDKYTFATNVVTSATALTAAYPANAAAGNATLGIFGGGRLNGSGASAATNVYTYASETAQPSTSLPATVYYLAAVSSAPGNF